MNNVRFDNSQRVVKSVSFQNQNSEIKKMSQIKTIIFDLGGVLIDWNPLYVFNNLIPDAEKRQFFFEKVCTMEWNEEQDAGRTIAEANAIKIAEFLF